MAGDNEEASTQRLQSSFGTSSSSLLKQHQQQQQQHPFSMNQLEIPQPNMPQSRGLVRPVPTNFAVENGTRRVGIPPSHPQIPPISPYSQIPVNRPGNQQLGFQNFSTNPGPSHSRSLSQPSFFANDSLPPLSPSPYRELHSNSISEQVSADVSMDEMDGDSHSLLMSSPFTRGGNSLRIGEGLPPRKAHRRSNSDIPFGFMSTVQPSPPLMPLRSPGALDRSMLVKRESSWENNGEGTGERKPEGEVVDDLFSAYMNLENIEAFNSSNTDEKPGEDLDSRASGTKTNGGDSSDNETTSSVNESGSSSQRAGVSSLPEKREGIKRSAAEDISPTTRHYRSISMDSFIGKISFGDESPKMSPSPGTLSSQQLSPTDSIDTNSNAFSLEFGNGEFTGAELKKIMANEKLAEIAMSDPKRAKR